MAGPGRTRESGPSISSPLSSTSLIYLFFTIFLLLGSTSSVDGLKRKSPLHSDVIEEVEAKRLDKLIQEQNFIAVLFCK